MQTVSAELQSMKYTDKVNVDVMINNIFFFPWMP